MLEKHHENQILVRLDEAFLTGSTFISWQELAHWFNVERIAKKPYREIHGLWQEICERRGYKTLPLEVRGLGPGNFAGLRLFRPYAAELDGERMNLDNLI